MQPTKKLPIKSSYPLVTKLALAGASWEFLTCAAWILCEQFVQRDALRWSHQEYPVLLNLAAAGLIMGVFVTPVLLIVGLFRLKRSQHGFAYAVKPFIWQLVLAISGLALPCLYLGEFALGTFHTVWPCLLFYALAFVFWWRR